MPKHALPRWAEAGTELLRQVGSLPGRKRLVATQLSSILGVDPAVLAAQVHPREEARRLTAALYYDTKAAMDSLQAPECTFWAPSDQSLLGRWIAAFGQHAAECQGSRTVHLLVNAICGSTPCFRIVIGLKLVGLSSCRSCCS